jgi:hypothetical protein
MSLETIQISASEDTPNILLDPGRSEYTISGRSLPEDVLTFYGPVMQWLERFVASGLPKLDLRIDLDYFNTASSKVLLDIFMKLEEAMENGTSTSVTWVYPSTDADMHEAGVEYSELVSVPFSIVAR